MTVDTISLVRDVDTLRGQPESGPSSKQPRQLRQCLITTDVSAAVTGLVVFWGLAAWLGGLTLMSGVAFATLVISTGVFTLIAMAGLHLYRARLCAVRAVEMSRLMRATIIGTLLAVALTGVIWHFIPLRWVIALAAVEFVALALGRSGYAAWLRHERSQGRYVRPVLLLGTNDEARSLYKLVTDQPELGFVVTAAAGRYEDDFPVPIIGTATDAVAHITDTGATGTIVAVTSFDHRELTGVLRDLAHHRIHTQLSSGFYGISTRRIHASPLAYEPLYYLEPPALGPWQQWIKRAVDITAATILLILAAPALAIAALAIKISDRGPVIFRQERVGNKGRPITVYKLRTMVNDAEAIRGDIEHLNERNGPLFKLDFDPRRTTVGRILELTSMDELPQLLNVIKGDMSLVGPRPALPTEVAQFDDELLTRLDVRPGITGLWQIEARDNASFDVYRRLDLFYVENWSLTLDLAIAFGTIRAVLTRLTQKLLHTTPKATPKTEGHVQLLAEPKLSGAD
jgi:exopolysaccharide biosynthesis polyprenyl glycosylphosphotransferase